jgi:ferredoxin
MGVPREQVRSEAFEAAVAASRAVPAGVEPAEPPASRVLTATRTHSVRLSRSGRTALATSERSLLEVAEDARVEIPNLCRAGTCGTCRTRLVSGDVECEAAVMDDEDRRAGYVFPCVAWARSDCELDA